MSLFNEDQKFSKIVNYILLAVTLIWLVSFLYSFNTPAFWGMIFSGTLLIALNVLFFNISLHTEIDSEGISIKFHPFHLKPKKFMFSEMQKCYVRKYNSLVEYGGWGIRYGINGKAYNTRGNMGIQIVLKNNKEILIGTQKPEEVENILKNYFKSGV